MIRSFGNRLAEALFHGIHNKESRAFPPDLTMVAERKLDLVNSARMLNDLQAPPGNRLEALKGDREGWFGIRINGQWRVVFRWQGSDAHDVSVIDYH